ncbi:hypothetical protein HPB50_000962 [Hyalomma asiaticum]|uniref:Uncharacterized protein n=1 Tax=Hyalomma asiaticum TaxID=266040 RepID=A0ACB7S6Z5_HYAAI|nr:hypothetical protein HPB50_000962 [Hyalomma asiaticum]
MSSRTDQVNRSRLEKCRDRIFEAAPTRKAFRGPKTGRFPKIEEDLAESTVPHRSLMLASREHHAASRNSPNGTDDHAVFADSDKDSSSEKERWVQQVLSELKQNNKTYEPTPTTPSAPLRIPELVLTGKGFSSLLRAQQRRQNADPQSTPAPNASSSISIRDSGVGKTSILFRFSDNKFDGSFISTIGIDFKIRIIEIDGKKIKLQIWDTAGQERFRTITTAYYRGAMGIMLVYDVTKEATFENIKTWIRNTDEHAAADVEKMILGNKCDMNELRQVSKERGEKLAIEHNIKFMETSAVSSINVEEAFYTLARDIKEKMERKVLGSMMGAHKVNSPLTQVSIKD